jgi:plasmid maintenance system antidote protein VapI
MNVILAKVFPPGEFLKDELAARGWSQTELAEVMDRPVRLINEIVAGKKSCRQEEYYARNGCTAWRCSGYRS